MIRKISTKNRTTLIIEKEKIIMYNNIKLEKGLILSQARHSHRRWLSLILTQTMRTQSLKVLTLLKDSSSVLTSR